MVLWQDGFMKTTLDLPDELARRIKMRAVMRNQKLKDTIAQLLELGLASAPEQADPNTRSRADPLKKHGPPTIDDIEGGYRRCGRD
ncbi:MAG: hypothetical protein R3F37_21115 [Candidatus Competibacteraceae bacterium]